MKLPQLQPQSPPQQLGLQADNPADVGYPKSISSERVTRPVLTSG